MSMVSTEVIRRKRSKDFRGKERTIARTGDNEVGQLVKDSGIVKKYITAGLRYAGVFFGVLMLLAGSLVLTAKIPQAVIQDNMLRSAEYLCEKKVFFDAVPGIEGSRIDRYADSILLGIAYQYDAAHPFRSVMESAYYYTPYQNENENLLEAVTEGLPANQQYLRYWHGSITIIRPLLVFLELRQIYVLNGVLLATLAAGLLLMLWKRKAYLPVLGILWGMVATSCWHVPLSLEYTWMYLLMLATSILCVVRKPAPAFFLVTGMLANYLDFLTTETLSLLVPLLLGLWLTLRQEPQVKVWKQTLGAAAAWGCGYAGMWAMKWVLASVALRENVMPYVTGHIEERLGTGEGTAGIHRLSYLWETILRNVRCLFPWEYGITGILSGCFLILLAVYFAYVYHREQVRWQHILLYLCVGAMPYLRYTVLMNHSYLHCFFTYRAQMATVLAGVLILGECVDGRGLKNAICSKGKL